MDFQNPFDTLPDWLKAYAAPIQQGFGATGDALGSLFNANAPASQFGQGRVPGGGMVPNMVNFAQSMRQAQPPPTAMAAPGMAPTPGPGGFGHDAVPRSYGTAGPMTPGTAGAAGTTAAPPSGDPNLDPRNLLKDPRAAVIADLRKRNINPYGGSPIVNSLLTRAGDIANSVTPNLAGASDPVQALLGGLSDAITRALSGQAVFYGAGQGNDLAGVLQGAQNRAGSPGAALGDQFLAELLSKPANAASIMSDLLYGGQGQAFSSVGARQLGDIAGQFNQDTLDQQNRDPNAPLLSFLDAMVQKRLPSLYGR